MSLSDLETKALRYTLGLHETCRTAITQNRMSPIFAERFADVMPSLLCKGYMQAVKGDPRVSHRATGKGMTVVLDQPWK
mgnify:CR=1 FL=1